MVKTKKVKKPRAPKPFADGTLTNAAFFGMLRSALRNKSRFFITIKNCRNRARVPYKGPNKRRKWLYKCEMCSELFDSKQVNIHHKIDCGTLRSFDDLPGFTKRLFCDSIDLMTICNDCHDKIHGKLKKKK